MPFRPDSAVPQLGMHPAKIAYVMSRFPKLTETFVFYEILAMESLGIAVEVYPLLREQQAVAHPEVPAWLERARFQPFISLRILRAHLHFARRRPAAYFGALWEALSRTWGSLNFFAGALGIFPKTVRFAYEMERRGVTHVHAHFATHPALAALIVHRLTGIPFSFTAHGSDLHVDRRMLDVKVAASEFAVTISDFNKEVMVAECGETLREKIRIVRCGIDPEVFVPPPVRPETATCRIICIASFEEVKGHRYLIEACRLLEERGVEFECHLVGDGPLRNDVRRWINDACLDTHVRMWGALPRPEVVRLLRESHVAVLASYPTKEGKREGIPVALMEAMGCGLPVVSTAISGIPELVESGHTGFLVPPRDALALADRLEALANDERVRRSFGAAGREKVLAEFNVRANTRQLLDLFLAESSASRRDHEAERVYAVR
jgi:colanic acid/amylovoran biosynthesis glycosyltransferase